MIWIFLLNAIKPALNYLIQILVLHQKAALNASLALYKFWRARSVNYASLRVK